MDEPKKPYSLDDWIDEGVREEGEAIKAQLAMPVSGISFRERLLLALIRAHPPHKGEPLADSQRLGRAVKAVFADHTRTKRSTKKNDDLALRWMAYWRLDDNAEHGLSSKKRRSAVALARKALPHADTGEEEVVIKRLTQRFRREEEELLELVGRRKETIECTQRAALVEIGKVLAHFEVDLTWEA